MSLWRLGTSRLVYIHAYIHTYIHTYIRTYIHTQAPELLVGYPYYDYSIDLWGVGCILAGMYECMDRWMYAFTVSLYGAMKQSITFSSSVHHISYIVPIHLIIVHICGTHKPHITTTTHTYIHRAVI